MSYIIVCLTETDGDVMIVDCPDMDIVRTMVKKLQLGPEDYSLIEGVVIKGMSNTTFDVKNYAGNLKGR